MTGAFCFPTLEKIGSVIMGMVFFRLSAFGKFDRNSGIVLKVTMKLSPVVEARK